MLLLCGGLTSKSLDTGGRRAPVNSGCTARHAAAAGAAPMRSGGQNRRMNGSFRGRKKLLLEHMTKPAWMMTECFGSRRQRQRCARARKGVQGRARASNAEGGHTLRFFSKFVSWANNSKIYQPNEFPRKQKNHPLKSFWNKPPSNPANFEQERP